MTAPHWDRVYREQPTPHIEPWQQRVQRTAAAYLRLGRGSRVLDLGCGQGLDTFYFASLGAQVVAVDTSPLAIRNIQALTIPNVSAHCMDAFEITTLGPFDAIYGSMVLHHLEPFDKFAAILGDALSPGGRGFFLENSAANPLLMWSRRHLVGRFGIPRYSDSDESPLSDAELDVLRRYFAVTVDRRSEFMLCQMIARYFRAKWGRRITAWADRQLSRILLLHQWSYWQTLLLTRR